MKSTTTARMPETTLIRVTLSISSPQCGLAPLALQFPSTTFVDWLLDSVWLSCCLQVVHLHIPPCYWHVPNSEQDVNRGSRTVTREILQRFAHEYESTEPFATSALPATTEHQAWNHNSGQASGNNFLIHENFHITINANGRVTAFVDNFSVDCR